MDAKVRFQDRDYRRGLILGLTMAEIMLLIIFCLLLALASALKNAHERESGLRALIANIGTDATMDAIVNEMRILRERVTVAESEVNRLKPFEQKASELNDIYKELTQAGIDKPESANGKKILSEMMQIAKEVKQASATNSEGNTIADMLSLANQVMSESERPGVTPNPAQIKQMLKDARSANQKVSDIIGQNKNLYEKLKAFGRGTEFPPCWANPDTGRPEYIFDVSIGSTGLTIRRNDLPHRTEQFESLPIQSIEFGRELSQAEFRHQTNAIRRWGEQQEQKCRFFVRLYDETKPDEKDTFKKYMLTTEESFYKYLVQQ